MTQATVPTYVYTVYTAEGCTVTAPGFPSFSVTCSPGMANSFTAPGNTVEISDPAATLVAVRTFNGALAALGLLGGGNTLPAGYTRLEYLEGTGTQFILTANDVTPDTGVRCEYEQLSAQDRLEEPVGTRGPNPAAPTVFWFMPRHATTAGSQQANFYSTYTFNFPKWGRVTAEMNFQGSGRLKVQNMQYSPEEKELKPGPDVTLPPLVLFGTAYRMKGRIWYCEISQRQNIVQSFIPALDPTGAPCMFDIVTRKPFYNSGTGDFVTPPTGASTYSLRGRRVLPDWGKLTPTGLRRLYHVPDGYQGDALQYAAENGFCPIVEEEQPAEGYWSPRWEEIGGVIYLSWVETAPPEELATGKE